MSGSRPFETRGADVLDAVLELAVIVAQAGLRTVPPLDAPVALRPFLGFTHKVPAPALRAARKVLDSDPQYRDRVAIVATEELVGEAGMLMLSRPDGWEAADRRVAHRHAVVARSAPAVQARPAVGAEAVRGRGRVGPGRGGTGSAACRSDRCPGRAVGGAQGPQSAGGRGRTARDRARCTGGVEPAAAR